MNNFHYQDAIESHCIFGNEAREDVVLTIVVPTYKRTELLEKTIKSILNQQPIYSMSYKVVIVSNDPEYSRDRIGLDLDDKIFSIYRNNENLNMVGNMNRCALITKSKYIAYVQDDDILLDNYLVEIEKLYINGTLDTIDCLIPNRYFYYDVNTDGTFGLQAYNNERKKSAVKKFVSFGKKKRLFQRVDADDCGNTWYNCFAGGPTCGMLFKRESLLNSEGFNYDFKYAFDYVFFIDFSKNNNVVLYDKYLSVYRMNDSASNRPDVQKDFFDSDMYLLGKLKNTNEFVKKYADEIIRFSYENKSKEAQLLISKDFPVYKNNLKYCMFRIVRLVKLLRDNLYRREIMPSEYKKLL